MALDTLERAADRGHRVFRLNPDSPEEQQAVRELALALRSERGLEVSLTAGRRRVLVPGALVDAMLRLVDELARG